MIAEWFLSYPRKLVPCRTLTNIFTVLSKAACGMHLFVPCFITGSRIMKKVRKCEKRLSESKVSMKNAFIA